MSDHERLIRELAEEIVINEAEYAAAGRRRLTVLHGLRPDQETELNELTELVDDVCRHHKIEHWGAVITATHPVGQRAIRTRWTSWSFAPPTAADDLATVRAAIQERYPDWPIEADDWEAR